MSRTGQEKGKRRKPMERAVCEAIGGNFDRLHELLKRDKDMYYEIAKAHEALGPDDAVLAALNDDAIAHLECAMSMFRELVIENERSDSAMPTPDKTNQGWSWPGLSKKAHYFVSGRSLCGKWALFIDDLDPSGTSSSDDCAACTRRLIAADRAIERISHEMTAETERSR